MLLCLKVLCLVELQTSNHHKVCHGQIRNKRTFFNQLVVYISGLKVKKWHEARKAHYQRDRLDITDKIHSLPFPFLSFPSLQHLLFTPSQNPNSSKTLILPENRRCFVSPSTLRSSTIAFRSKF